jgi:hypothetical protein
MIALPRSLHEVSLHVQPSPMARPVWPRLERTVGSAPESFPNRR